LVQCSNRSRQIFVERRFLHKTDVAGKAVIAKTLTEGVGKKPLRHRREYLKFHLRQPSAQCQHHCRGAGGVTKPVRGDIKSNFQRRSDGINLLVLMISGNCTRTVSKIPRRIIFLPALNSMDI